MFAAHLMHVIHPHAQVNLLSVMLRLYFFLKYTFLSRCNYAYLSSECSQRKCGMFHKILSPDCYWRKRYWSAHVSEVSLPLNIPLCGGEKLGLFSWESVALERPLCMLTQRFPPQCCSRYTLAAERIYLCEIALLLMAEGKISVLLIIVEPGSAC